MEFTATATMESLAAEKRNFYRLSAVLLDGIRNSLRQVVVTMWNDRFASAPGLKKWDDSTEVRKMFLAKEGGKTNIPTDKSIMEWHSTDLFSATLYSQTFAILDVHGKHHTLYELYVKPLPNGVFHESVQSPTGNAAETTALALDQLRLLRNTLCHLTTQEIDQANFDQYITLAKDAFTALKVNSNVIDHTVKLTAEDFHMAKIQQLESELEIEKSVVLGYEQMDTSSMNEMKSQVGNQVANDKLFSLISKIVCERNGPVGEKDLRGLVCELQELKMDVLEELFSYKNQKVNCIIHKSWISCRPVFFILTWNSQPKSLTTDNNLNSDSKHVTSESGNIRDPNLSLFSSSNDYTKQSPVVLLWQIARGLKKKELLQVTSSLHESVHMLCLQPTFQKGNTEAEDQDFYMELMLPACGSTASSLCKQIDHLPILVDLELTDSHECHNIDSVVNHSSKSAHISYFSYRFPDQRQAEFLFDHLIFHLDKTLALTKVLDAMISSVHNEAFFTFLEPSCNNSSLAIIAEKQSVTVKCRTASQFQANCVCLSVRTALDTIMESLCPVVALSFKPCLQLPCEEIDGSCRYQDAESESSSGFASETGNSHACASGSDPEDDLEEEQSVVLSQYKDRANIQCADLGDDQVHLAVEPAWYILECTDFGNGNSSSDAQASGSDGFAPSDFACFDESKELDTSLWSVDSASSLNSYPPSPDYPERVGDESSVGSNFLQDCDGSTSSYDEGLSSGEVCPDAETMNWEEDKPNVQSGLPSYTEPEAVHCKKPQGSPDPSFSPVLQGSENAAGAIDNVIGQSHQREELAFYRNQCHELRQQNIQLKETLKQTEEELQQLQGEIGRQQFLEEREKRSEKILQSSMEYGNEKSKSCAASGETHTFTGRKGKLLGGAAPLQVPGFKLQHRLLEISDSLSEAELKKMKFLVKPKVNWSRLARIREGFELFEELEMTGELSCTYVRELLEGIQRFDLAEILGTPFADSAANASCRPTDQRMLNKANEPPNSSSPPPTLKVSPSGDSRLNASPLQHVIAADKTSNGMHLQGGQENVKLTEIDEGDSSCSLSSGNSENSGGDMAVLSKNVHCYDSSMQGGSSSEEHTCPTDSSNGGFLSTESSSTTVSSSELSTNSSAMAGPLTDESTSSPCTSQDVTLNLPSAVKNCERSDEISYSLRSSEEDILQSSLLPDDTESESGGMDTVGAGTAQDERISEVSGSSGNIPNGPMEPAHLEMRCAGTDFVDSVPYRSPDRVQTSMNSGLMKDALPDGHISVHIGENNGRRDSALNDSVTEISAQSNEWEHLGARPKNRPPLKLIPPASSMVDLVPQEVTGYEANGVANAFLARHSQDKGLHDSLYQNSAEKVLANDSSSQGTSYVDGMLNVSERNKAKPCFGDCQADVHNGLFPFPPVGYDSHNGVGGCAYNGQFSSQTGLVPGPSYSNVTCSNFLGNGNFPWNSAFNSSGNISFRSDFELGSSRPFGMGHFDMEHPHCFHSGMAGSYFGSSSLVGATGPQLTPPIYGTQRHGHFNENTSAISSERKRSQTPWEANSGLANQSNVTTNRDFPTGNIARADVHLGSAGLPALNTTGRNNGDDNRHDAKDESSRTSQNGTTRSNVLSSSGHHSVAGADGNPEADLPSSQYAQLLAAAYAHENGEPQGASSTAGSMLNTDFGTDSVESTDNSLLALEQRVEEACALVERVLREREEREQFGREIERKEREIREQRARKRREREARELEEANRWPHQQEAITGRSQWLCEHYQRHCRVRFPCCTHFYPCHRCHNNSKACDNEEAKASHATHLKCSLCHHEQEIDEESGKCGSCGAQMSAYFCSICKHFTSVDKNPYHCEKCGICRIHKDKSFHCEVCNVCLDKRLEGKHKCRPDSGHDECCICLEDAFSGCQILPCSHKVHRECAIAMIQNGIRTCPVCRHPLYSPAPE